MSLQHCIVPSARLAWLLASLAAVCLGGPATARDATRLRVMTFNIRYAMLTSPGHEWEGRRDMIVEIIRQYQPDIVGLQEDMTQQVAYLESQLPDYQGIYGPISGAPRTLPWSVALCLLFALIACLLVRRVHRRQAQLADRKSGRLTLWLAWAVGLLGVALVVFAIWLHYIVWFNGEHNAVLVRRATIEPQHRTFFWLSHTPEKPCSYLTWWTHLARVVVNCRIRIPATGQQLDVYNIHLSPVSRYLQQAGMEVILSQIRSSPPADLTLVIGDFNVNPSGGACQLLESEGFVNAWKVAGQRVGPSFTSHMFRGVDVQLSRRFGLVDHIYMRPELEVERAEVVTYSDGGRYPSDHFPVVADIVLPAQADES